MAINPNDDNLDLDLDLELDLDRLLAEAEYAAAEADEALERLTTATPLEVAPPQRSHEERMKAVVEVIDQATPERQVRTPAERRAAVQAVLEARQREIESRRRQREVQAAAAAAPPPAEHPEPILPLTFPERSPEMAAKVVEQASRERRPRTDAERLHDAKQAAIDELERRRHEVAARNRRMLEDKAGT
ncbi:MAG TPA: hypothetical protein VI916_09230 [Acidimicrobiia bacterium]|nr:hypothetical protein [Acidimicrobiia bacterium]